MYSGWPSYVTWVVPSGRWSKPSCDASTPFPGTAGPSVNTAGQKAKHDPVQALDVGESDERA